MLFEQPDGPVKTRILHWDSPETIGSKMLRTSLSFLLCIATWSSDLGEYLSIHWSDSAADNDANSDIDADADADGVDERLLVLYFSLNESVKCDIFLLFLCASFIRYLLFTGDSNVEPHGKKHRKEVSVKLK